MKVFISWSGEPSRSIAAALHGWLGVVIQHVRPWMSDAEIESGTRWNEVIAANLEDADFGVVCVTRSNQSAPWLMFESGALAKRLDVARLVPLCIDLEPAEVISPLQSFQSRKLDKEGVRRLIHELREMSDQPLSREHIDRLFERMWPELEEQVRQATTQHRTPDGPRRSPDDMLAELVTRVRNLEREGEHERSHGELSKRDVAMMHDASMILADSVSRLTRLTKAVEEYEYLVRRLEGRRPEQGELELSPRQTLDTAGVDYELSEEPRLRIGERVKHRKFGAGRVTNIQGKGDKQRAHIEFDDGRQLWMAIQQAPFVPIQLDPRLIGSQSEE